MKSPILLILLIFSLFGFHQVLLAQPYRLDVRIVNQPEEYIRLESVSGDNFTLLDSAQATKGEVHFELPNDAHTGIYRLIFGKTGYARVMNEDPQMLDFIFNKENIQLKTDFKDPVQSVEVIQSKENDVYFDFLIRLKEYQSELGLMEQEVDSYWAKGDSAKAMEASNEFNRVQLDWDLRAAQIIQQNHTLFASKLIEWKRTPLRDAFLSPEERKETYRKEFLQNVNFSDESLIYSTAYTDKIFEFLTLFNEAGLNRQQRTQAYIDAVDMIFAKLGQNEKVDQFLIGYLDHGFHVLGMKEVIDHIKETTN